MRVLYSRLFLAGLALTVATGLLAQSRSPAQISSGMVPLGQGITFFVRHAEPVGAGADGGLSDAGRARAISLAALLKDAGITAIFVTEFRRTRETAAPLANSLGITPTIVGAADLKELAYKVRRTGGNALIVGHTNTLPVIMRDLGLPNVTIGDADFDNVFIAVPGSSNYGSSRLIRLHYR